jgi:hypothetical protein
VNRPATAKEALIAEALGDMAGLIDRLEKLVPVMSTAHQELVQGSNHLVRQVTGFEVRMADLSQNAAELCVKQIEQKASGVCAQTLNSQILAMQSAAREVFNKAFRRVVFQLKFLARLAQPDQNRWLPWLTHGASFVTGIALTWLAVVMIWVQ